MAHTDANTVFHVETVDGPTRGISLLRFLSSLLPTGKPDTKRPRYTRLSQRMLTDVGLTKRGITIDPEWLNDLPFIAPREYD